MESQTASIIVLSGGTSSRFGSDKSQATLGSMKIIDYVLSNIPKKFRIIVVGPDPLLSGAQYKCVREAPLSGGPVAGVCAALEICTSAIVGILATDMPFAISNMLNLLASMRSDDDAVMYVDSSGFRQPLAAFYRADALHKAIALLPQINGASMRELIVNLNVHELFMSQEVEKSYLDVDTAHDLSLAKEYLREL
jgi:molybdopterin-guanine dinucleotide biosynthesis protein A